MNGSMPSADEPQVVEAKQEREERIRLNNEISRSQQENKAGSAGGIDIPEAPPLEPKLYSKNMATAGSQNSACCRAVLEPTPLPRNNPASFPRLSFKLSKISPSSTPASPLERLEPLIVSGSAGSQQSQRPRPNFGNAFLVAPQNMDEFESYTVTLKLSDQEIAKFLKQLKEKEPQLAAATTTGVLLSNFVRVELIGDDFKIEAKDKSLNMHKVDPTTGQVADWVWIVSPQSWGKNKRLTAHIYSLEDSKGDFVLKEVATKNLEVSVSVSAFDSNIKAVAQLILLPLAGWGSKQGWDWFKNRKRPADNPAQSQPLPDIPVEEEAPRQAA